MASPFYKVTDNSDTVFASDIDQFSDAFNAANDVGTISLFQPITAPGAPTVAVNTTAGNLTGAYLYKIAFVTGYWKGAVGTGALTTQGNTRGGTASASVSPSAQQVNVTAIPTGPTGTVARIIYRTKAGGSTYYQVAQINDNTTTSYTDNTADTSLTVSMPASNTTGTTFTMGSFSVSPSGIPTAPTAAINTNTTQLATTAFVLAQASSSTPSMDGTAAIGTSYLFARADHVHPTDTSRAALASPAFTGTPTAPTAAAGTSTTQLATTAFVIGQAGVITPNMDGAAAVGIGTRYSREDHVHPTDTSRAPLASPTFTGTPAAPTAAAGTNTTQLATTAFVIGQAGSATPAMDGAAAVGTSLLYARQDHVHPTDTSRAPLASPTFTGTPAAPTAVQNTNTTQIATTAFVVGQAGSATPVMNGTAAVGTSLLYARQDHVHPTDTTLAPLASPALTGTPTAPTAASGTNTTQLATTAFVTSAVGNVNTSPTKASANDLQITSTSATTVATYTPTAKSNYLIGVYLRVVTGATSVAVSITYTSATGAQTTTVIPTQTYAVGDYSLPLVFINATVAAINVNVTASIANQVYASTSIMGV